MDASQLSHDLFLRILAVSAQASVLAVLIVALQRLLRGWLSPAWRYMLWGLLLVRLLLLWTVPSSWSLSTAAQRFWTAAHEAVVTAPVPAVTSEGILGSALSVHTPPLSVMHWAAALWVIGALLAMALALVQAVRLGRQAKRRTPVTDPEVLALLEECGQRLGVRRSVPLLRGPDTSTPALLGFLRPRLLIPARLLTPEARAHLRCVLLHELAHVRRGDVLTGWLAYLLLCLHWFNPVLWWARRRCIDDRELACDARVLQLLTPQERRAYGHALLDQFRAVSTPLRSPGLVGVLEGTSSIERRIEMIAAFGKTTRKGNITALAVVLLLSVTALTGEDEMLLSAPAAGQIAAPTLKVDTSFVLAEESDYAPGIPTPTPMPAPEATTAQVTSPAAEAVPVDAVAPQPGMPPAPAAPVKANKPKAKVAKSAPVPKSENVPAPVATVTAGAPKAPDTAATEAAPAASAPAVAAPVEQPAAKHPATLHSAVNKVADDYAKSIEVKSTRPGEDLPFTLTVGGEIRIRGEYRTGLPKHSCLPKNDVMMSTRVGVCADFGQLQCVAEVQKAEGSSALFGSRHLD